MCSKIETWLLEMIRHSIDVPAARGAYFRTSLTGRNKQPSIFLPTRIHDWQHIQRTQEVNGWANTPFISKFIPGLQSKHNKVVSSSNREVGIQPFIHNLLTHKVVELSCSCYLFELVDWRWLQTALLDCCFPRVLYVLMKDRLHNFKITVESHHDLMVVKRIVCYLTGLLITTLQRRNGCNSDAQLQVFIWTSFERLNLLLLWSSRQFGWNSLFRTATPGVRTRSDDSPYTNNRPNNHFK